MRELREAYSPSPEETDWAREMTDTDENRLSLMVWLKYCQRLGRFPRLAEIPAQVIVHVRDELGLPEHVGMAGMAKRTGRNHKALVRGPETAVLPPGFRGLSRQAWPPAGEVGADTRRRPQPPGLRRRDW